MPLPLAHALVGGTLAVAVWPERTAAGLAEIVLFGPLLAVAVRVSRRRLRAPC